jgi:hypothetical protein
MNRITSARVPKAAKVPRARGLPSPATECLLRAGRVTRRHDLQSTSCSARSRVSDRRSVAAPSERLVLAPPSSDHGPSGRQWGRRSHSASMRPWRRKGLCGLLGRLAECPSGGESPAGRLSHDLRRSAVPTPIRPGVRDHGDEGPGHKTRSMRSATASSPSTRRAAADALGGGWLLK